MKTCKTCKHWKDDGPSAGECQAITGETEVYVSGQGLYPETGVLVTVADFGCTLHEDIKPDEPAVNVSDPYLWFRPSIQQKSQPKFQVGDRVCTDQYGDMTTRSAGLLAVGGTVSEVSPSASHPGQWQYIVQWDDGVQFKRAFLESQLHRAPDKPV